MFIDGISLLREVVCLLNLSVYVLVC
jgi:hypothetical protein